MGNADYFNNVAQGYKQLDIGSTPIRKYTEVPSLKKLFGFLQGLNILELACSDGFFSRMLMEAGAASVTAIDLSPEMIALAMETEALHPLGIEYKVGDILDPDLVCNLQFDMIFLPFMLSYAENADELATFCTIIHKRLKPGGKLISMNDNPDLLPDSVTGFAKYGKTKFLHPPATDGACITVTWLDPNSEHGTVGQQEFKCHYFCKDTLCTSLMQAGFTDIELTYPEVSAEGIAEHGQVFWRHLQSHPLVVFIQCQKPG